MNFYAKCPVCDNQIKFYNKPDVGKKLSCRLCETALVVSNGNPIRLVESIENYPENYPSGFQFHSQKYHQTMHCDLCGGKIEFHRKPKMRDRFMCPDCDAELVVVSTSPVRMKAIS